MPENDTALEPVLDQPPPTEIHTYMTPSVGQSVTVFPDFAQAAVGEFRQERLELDTLEDDDAPVKVETSVSALAESLGGVEAVEALAQVLNNPNADLTQILPPEQIESLIWSGLENPSTQAVILADPSVRATKSPELLLGHKIEDVQAWLSDFQRGDGRTDEQIQAEYLAAENRVQAFQRDFFTDNINELVTGSGVDESDVEAITDRLLLARTRFLQANAQEYLHIQGLHEAGKAAPLQETRLRNKWTAVLLRELGKLSGGSK